MPLLLKVLEERRSISYTYSAPQVEDSQEWVYVPVLKNGKAVSTEVTIFGKTHYRKNQNHRSNCFHFK